VSAISNLESSTIDSSPALRFARIAAFVVIVLLFGLWLAGVLLFIQGITADLDRVLEAIFVADTWAPSAVRDAADGLSISPDAPAWVWLGIELVGVTSFGVGGLVLFSRKPDWFGTYLGVAFVLIGTNISGSVTGMVSETVPSLALFSPVRQRVQRIIDRRFYRRRFDAQRALETFNAQMRDQVDLDQMHEAILAMVGHTVQPESVSLWLVKPSGTRPMPVEKHS
jgi:hypothetical protein